MIKLIGGYKKGIKWLVDGDQAGMLPRHHKDPFDRMLIAQAQSEGLAVVTSDEKIARYGIRVMDARS